MLKLPKELELILCCIKDAPSTDFTLADDFDWGFFIELVAKHKVENIIRNKLPLLNKDIPKKVTNVITRLSNKSRFRNLLQAKLLKELVGEFDKHEIKALFVKGLMTYSLYPDEKYLRPARDIDFLIDWQDVQSTLDVLATMGFKLLSKNYKESMGSLDLRYKKSGMLLELHWNLWSKREEIPTKFSQLYQRRKYLNRYNIKIPTIDAPTHISYLCYHGTVHFWYRLFWLIDIYLIIKNKDTDWDAVIKAAKDNGSMPSVNLAVAIAADLFEIQVPAEFSNNLMTKTKKMRQEIWQVMADNPHGLDFEPKNLKDILERVRWKLRAKSKYKLRTIIKLLLIR